MFVEFVMLQLILFHTEDRQNGLWSDDGGLAGPYLLPSSTNDVASGCNYNEDLEIIESCNAAVV